MVLPDSVVVLKRRIKVMRDLLPIDVSAPTREEIHKNIDVAWINKVFDEGAKEVVIKIKNPQYM